MGFRPVSPDELDTEQASGPSVTSGFRPVAEDEIDATPVMRQPTWGESAEFGLKALLEGGAGTLDTLTSAFRSPSAEDMFLKQKLGSMNFGPVANAEAYGKDVDMQNALLGKLEGNAAPITDLVHRYIGRPEDSGVTGTVADLSKAAIEASTFPGGPVLNALSGVGGEVAHKLFPESTVAPILGSLAGGAGVGALKTGAGALKSSGQAIERASLGARVSDYIKSLSTNGLQEDEIGDVATKLSKSIGKIGDTDGFGLMRTTGSLSKRIGGQLDEIGSKIGKGLEAADNAGIVPSIDLQSPTSATQKLLAKAGAAKKQLTEALDEFKDNLLDPQNGWDGTTAGLNQWKTSVANQGFSGTAKGTLAPAMARKLQRAIASDLGEAVNTAVIKSGHATADDWGSLMSRYGDYATVAPIVNRQAVSALADSADKGLRSVIRTSGGAITTPTIIATALGGPAAAPIGLLLGGGLALSGTATGRGVVGNILKATGKAGQAATKGAELASVGGLVNTSANPANRKAVEPKAAEEKRSEKTSAKYNTSFVDKAMDRAEGEMLGLKKKPVADVDLGDRKSPDYVKKVEAKIDADPYYSALYATESSRNPNAVPRDKKTGKLLSSAKGAFQFVDDTARRVGLKDPFDIGESFEKVQELTNDHIKRFGTNPARLYAAHFLGATTLDRWLKGKPLTEKQEKHVREFRTIALPNFMRNYEKVTTKKPTTVEA